MSFPRIERRDVVQIFHNIEARVTRLFRLGAALRPPDFLSEFGRKVAQFIARNFPNHEHRPTIVVPHPSRAPASVRSADPPDPTLEGLEQPFFKRREELLDENRVPAPPAVPTTINPVEIAQDTLEEIGDSIAKDTKEAATEFVSTLKEAAAEAGDALGKKATEFVEAAKESLSNAIDWFTGSPPSSPPAEEAFPNVISEERRQELAKCIESQTEMHWLGLKKPEEPKPSEVQHRQPAIKRWYDKPKPEPVLYDGRPERALEEMQKKTDGEPAPEPPHVAPFTDEEEKQATISARRVKEELNTEVLKQQEEEIAKQNTEAANRRKQKAEPPPEPRFDPTQAEKFENWGDPAGKYAAHPETVVEQSAELKTESRKHAAPLATGTNSTTRTDSDDPVPPKRRLQRRPHVADLRKQRRQTEEFHNKLVQLSKDAAARPPRRKPALKLALTEGIQTSTKPAGKPLPDSSLRPATARRVQFGDFVKESEIEVSAEERAIDAEEIVRTVHEEMRPRLVEGDRFIRLMLIALYDTELPTNRKTDPHKMAIELYRAFSKKAPDRWAEQAESTIRQQLEARPRDDALRALEPIVKYFDRYSGQPSKKERPGMQFLHQRLGQLGMILHKLQNEQASRTD
jgi:hypothetical protein